MDLRLLASTYEGESSKVTLALIYIDDLQDYIENQDLILYQKTQTAANKFRITKIESKLPLNAQMCSKLHVTTIEVAQMHKCVLNCT